MFFTILFIVISIFKSFGYFYNINSYEYDDIYYGAVINEKIKNKIPKIIEYINKSDDNVIVFSTEAAFYIMPLNKSNGYMDEPLLGNFGKEGEDGVIKEIKEMKNTTILINKEKQSYQESDKIRQYIKENLKYMGKIEDFLIYETKEE